MSYSLQFDPKLDVFGKACCFFSFQIGFKEVFMLKSYELP